jgi:hypothetical protein
MAAAARALRTGLPGAPKAAVGRRGPGRAGPGMTPEWFALLLTVLAGVPHLENPACSGRPDLFDGHPARDVDRQHDQETALRWCARCPALGPCRAWLAAMPAWNRPAGSVMAGQVLETPRNTPATGAKPGPKTR